MKPEKKIIVLREEKSSLGITTNLEQSFKGAVATEQIDAKTLKSEQKLDENVLAFVMPAIIGEDSPYEAALGTEGNQVIRSYVENGGMFIGVCAGAYYAAKDILFDVPWLETPKTSSPGLDFFNGLAKCALPSKAVNEYDEWYSDCIITNIRFTDKDGNETETGIAYGNGPALYPYTDDNDLTIWARYEDTPDKPAAIASRPVGNGSAVFMGVLPYIGHFDVMPIESLKEVHAFSEMLKPHEEGRKIVWNSFIESIISHNEERNRLDRQTLGL